VTLNSSNRGLALVAGHLALQIPVLRGKEPLRRQLVQLRFELATHLSDTAANCRDKRQDNKQNEKVQDLPVDLSLNRRPLDRRIASISAQNVIQSEAPTYVAFRNNLVSCPAFTTIPYTHSVFRS